MSMQAGFDTWEEIIEYLKTIDRPQCVQVNYMPKTNSYELWMGNQPYHNYEKWLEELDDQNFRYRKAIKVAIDEVYEEYDPLWIIKKLERALEK